MNRAQFEAAEALFRAVGDGTHVSISRHVTPARTYDYLQIEWVGPASEWPRRVESFVGLAAATDGYLTGSPGRVCVACSCGVMAADAAAGEESL
jgi:hypothetical protein